MPNLRLVLLLVCSSTLAFADTERDAQWRDAAKEQLRARMTTEWMMIVNAETSVGWTIRMPDGKQFVGAQVVRTSDGWTYFFEYTKVRCRMQPGTPSRLTCGDSDFVDATAAKIEIRASKRPGSLSTLLMLQRGVFGNSLAMSIDGKGIGRANLETIVSSPMAASRTSRRYRAPATFTLDGFIVGEPVLVEQYQETCMSVNGCHDIHWSCFRVK